jgi:hypothetical protein
MIKTMLTFIWLIGSWVANRICLRMIWRHATAWRARIWTTHKTPFLVCDASDYAAARIWWQQNSDR